MTHSLGRLAIVGTTLTLLATGLTGCGFLDGSSRVKEALEYLPANTTTVTFFDRAAAAERHDIDGLKTGASDGELDRWMAAVAEDGYGTGLLGQNPSLQESSFSDFDIEWEVLGEGESGSVRVWKMSRDLDFDEVADDLADAGFERSGPDDLPVFHVDLQQVGDDGLIDGRFPAILSEIVLVPGEDLIITGDDLEAAAKVASDEEDSLADTGAGDRLLKEAGDLDDLEYAALNLEGLCGANGAGVGEGVGLYVVPNTPVRLVRLFADNSAAEQDAEGLRSVIEGTVESNDLGLEIDIRAEGPVVQIMTDFEDRLMLIRATQQLVRTSECPGDPNVPSPTPGA